MKKIFKGGIVVAIAAVCALALAACGGSSTETYSDDAIGFSVEAASGLEAQTVAGYDLCYVGDECMIMAVHETFAEAKEIGIDTTDYTVEEYAALLKDVYEMPDGFAPDAAGNLYSVYTSEIDGNTFAYYVTLRKGTDSFYIVNFVCLDEDYEKYAPQFEAWNDSIVVK